MKTSTSIYLGLALAICLVLIPACAFRKPYTGDAPAVVTDLHTEGSGKNRRYYQAFRYTVNGKTYDATNNKSGSSVMKYPTGTQGKACYMPADPQKAYFADAHEVCGT